MYKLEQDSNPTLVSKVNKLCYQVENETNSLEISYSWNTGENMLGKFRVIDRDLEINPNNLDGIDVHGIGIEVDIIEGTFGSFDPRYPKLHSSMSFSDLWLKPNCPRDFLNPLFKTLLLSGIKKADLLHGQNLSRQLNTFVATRRGTGYPKFSTEIYPLISTLIPKGLDLKKLLPNNLEEEVLTIEKGLWWATAIEYNFPIRQIISIFNSKDIWIEQWRDSGTIMQIRKPVTLYDVFIQ
jgi:hypothetical protein